jgi:hypothetical protein
MNGHVKVPVKVSPSSIRHGSSIRVTWATTDAAAGFVYDVQIRRPADGWAAWKVGLTEGGRAFTPKFAGRYRFRARLRATAGASSGWSDATVLTAT